MEKFQFNFGLLSTKILRFNFAKKKTALSHCFSFLSIFHVPSKLHTVKTNIIIQTYHCFGYALDLLVTVSSMCYHTSTSALSTSSSSRGFTSLRMGYLILRGASRLDAFSVYPFPAWLLCYAFGKTTDTPAASPSRSSRTKDSSSQISYAHAG